MIGPTVQDRLNEMERKVGGSFRHVKSDIEKMNRELKTLRGSHELSSKRFDEMSSKTLQSLERVLMLIHSFFSDMTTLGKKQAERIEALERKVEDLYKRRL